ncbi:MAG TPA: GAF domain-containing protein [Candidatus Acidoferrum sp.]|jgi:PAS domain S-box-containing protein|nr:GAF domain-containing protein [Candidatus Acidoferrum sp.]
MSVGLQEIEGGGTVLDSREPGPECRIELLEDRQWAEAVLAGEKRVLEMIAGGNDLASILDALCRVAEEICSGSLCSILLLDANGERLWQGAAPSLPSSYTEVLNGREIASCWGPCGLAALRKEQVIAADIGENPLWERCRGLLRSHGLESCWSTPILSSEGKVLGTFAILSREPRSPRPKDQKLIERFTHLASIAIERARGEEALRRSEAYLAEAQRLSHTGSFGWNVSTGELVWSAETYCILGYDRALKPKLELVLQRVHPEDVPLVQQMINSASGEATSLDFEHRLLMPDGMVKHLHVLAHAVKNNSREVEFVGAVRDVTGRKRAEALVAGEKRLLEMIARGGPLAPILDSLCRYGEELSGNVLVSILLASSDGKTLRHGAAPSLPKTYTEAIDGASIGPSAGSCGTAAYRREPIIVSNIATDPLWDRHRHLALPHGFRACWSAPIFSTAREVMGTFALYSREPGTPTPEQRNVIEQMTHLAAVAIERERAEQALRRSESRFQGILEIADDAIISVDSDQRVLLFNQGAEKVFGYAATEVIGQPLDFLLPQRFVHAHQKHVEEFSKSPEISRTMAQRREVFGRRKDGREFPAEASISKLKLGEEVIFTVILRDITERKEAAETLRASAQLARGQTEALARTLDAMAKESAPDRLVEHVLRTITEQLEAHSSSIWLRNESNGLVNFEFAFEEGKLLTGADAALAKVSPALRIEEVWPWPEVFRTGKPSVLEDIREGSSFPWRDHVRSLGVITILIVPLVVAGQVEGVVGIRFTRKRSFRPEEMDLAQALAHQAMLACQLRRLSRQSRQAAVVAERNRLARDIHDTLAQGFTGVIIQLEAVEEAMSQGMGAKAGEHLTRAGELARESLQEARRSVRALRPQTLEEKDICEALQSLFRKMTAGTSVRAEFSVSGQPPELPPEWEENLLRIGQEVLTNVLRHAQASEFKARLAFDQGEIALILRDNGRGFDPAGRHDGFGLPGMRERVEAMGGRLSIQSSKGQGATISIVLPFPNTSEAVTP